MNKQELIEKLGERITNYKERAKDKDVLPSSKNTLMSRVYGLAQAQTLVEELEEISLVTVPKFVADWFEKNKDDLDFAIYAAVAHSIKESDYYRYPEGFIEWIELADNKPIETIIRMKNGYEVEEDKLYKVIIDHKYLVQIFSGKTDARLVEFEELTIWSESAYKLTEETIKSIDERYWAFAVPVEEAK